MDIETQKQLDKLRQDLDALNAELYTNNFSALQIYNKYSNFTTQLKIPHYASLPTKCEVGEILESGGKLYICSSTNSFSLVGTQT